MTATVIDFAAALEQNHAIAARFATDADRQPEGEARALIARIAGEMGFAIDADAFLALVRAKQGGAGELDETELAAVAGGSGRSGVTYGYVCGAINSFMLRNNPWW